MCIRDRDLAAQGRARRRGPMTLPAIMTGAARVTQPPSRLPPELDPRGAASLQLVWTGIGLLLFSTVLVVVHGHQLLQRYAYSAALAGLGLLFLPVVLPARFSEVNGAKLWIRVGGLSVQPSEIAKILLVEPVTGAHAPRAV